MIIFPYQSLPRRSQMWLWNRWLGQPTKREADKNRTHILPHRLVQSPWRPHTKPDVATRLHTRTHLHRHIIFITFLFRQLWFMFSIPCSLCFIMMRVSCWPFAVFCLQGPRGLVGPRGPPGSPGQPVSQHHLVNRMTAFQSLQLDERFCS